MNKKLALVTGANRGLGLATAKKLYELGYDVLAGVRDASKFNEAGITPVTLDVSSDASVKDTVTFLTKNYQKLDVLVNNAGIFPEPYDPKTGNFFATPPEVVASVFNTNALSAFRLCQGLVPLMKGKGRIVNVSSGLGQLSEMQGLYPAYRISKTAMNAITATLAYELRKTTIKVNSVCPGWVKTDMGGPSATRSIEEGILGIIWAATLPDDGPTGGFFRDGKPINW